MRKPILVAALASLCSLSAMAQIPEITQKSPAPNTTAAVPSGNITLTWSTALASTTANAGNIKVWGSQTPSLYSTAGTITLSTNGTVVTINPTNNFRAGEQIFVSVQTGIQSTSGTPIASSQTWSFFAAAQGDGFFNPDPTYPLENDQTDDMVAGDIDGDGDMDIIECIDDDIELYRNNGNGTFSYDYRIDDLTDESNLLLVDLDNDGDLDLVAIESDEDEAHFYENDGLGNYSDQGNEYLHTNITRDMSVFQADFNGDGNLDILAGDSFIINNGNFNFTINELSVSWNFTTCGDIDGDGDQDILVSHNQIIALYLNNGSAQFTLSTSITATHASGTTRIRIADMNNDGNLDIVYSSQGGHTGLLFNNGGAVSFNDQMVSTMGFYLFNVGDFNGDGRIDIVGAEDNDKNIFIILNSSIIPYSSNQKIGCYTRIYGFSIADINGDSKPDILAFTDDREEDINIFLNSPSNGIQLSTSAVAFTPVAVGGVSTTSVTLSFTSLTQNLVFESASTHFTVSLDNVNFAATTTVSTTATSPQTIYVRFSPFETGTHSSIIEADLGCIEYGFEVTGEGSIADGVVLNTLNSGPGSLRYALENATSGTVITFANGLSGTFTITGSPIVIHHPLNINFQSLTGGGNIIINSGASAAIQFDCGSAGTVLTGVSIISSHPSGGVISTCPDVQAGKVQSGQIVN